VHWCAASGSAFVSVVYYDAMSVDIFRSFIRKYSRLAFSKLLPPSQSRARQTLGNLQRSGMNRNAWLDCRVVRSDSVRATKNQRRNNSSQGFSVSDASFTNLYQYHNVGEFREAEFSGRMCRDRCASESRNFRNSEFTFSCLSLHVNNRINSASWVTGTLLSGHPGCFVSFFATYMGTRQLVPTMFNERCQSLERLENMRSEGQWME